MKFNQRLLIEFSIKIILMIMTICLEFNQTFPIKTTSKKTINTIQISDPIYWKNLAIQRLSQLESKVSETEKLSKSNKAKNVILFIGDGMGLSTITASRIFKSQLSIIEQFKQIQQNFDNKKEIQTLLKQIQQEKDYDQLSFDSFDSVGLIKTSILDSQVGDSGACATAMMSGIKANFETVGVSGQVKFNDCKATIDPGSRVSTLIDWAQQQGKSTGFITTTRVTHATPAALYAHSASRYWECDDKMMAISSNNNSESNTKIDPKTTVSWCKDIARQLFEDEPGRNLNVIMGGGRRNLVSKENNGRRLDGRNLIDFWLKDKNQRSLQAKYVSNRKSLQNLDTNKVDYLLGIFAENHMSHEIDRNQSDSGEPSITEMAIKAIEILKHNPNGYVLMVESGRIDHAHHLNNAYRALTDTLALDETVEQLILKHINLEQTLLLVTADHSHVFTFGGFPSRENLILSVDDQVSDLDYLPYTTLMYANGPGYQQFRENLTTINTAHKDYIQQSAIPKRWETHGGEDVPIYAHGPGSSIFSGVMDQTFLPFGISYAGCFGPMAELFCSSQSSSTLRIQHKSIENLNIKYNNNYQSINHNQRIDNTLHLFPKNFFDHHYDIMSSSSSSTILIQCWRCCWLWPIFLLFFIITMHHQNHYL